MKLFESICGNAQSGSLQSFSQWGWNSTSHPQTSLAFHSKVIWFHLCNIFNFLWSNLLITYFTLLYFTLLFKTHGGSDKIRRTELFKEVFGPLPAERINSCYKIWISKPAPQYTDPNTNQIHHPKYQICNTKCKKQPFKKDNYLLLLLKTPYQVPNTPHPKYQICNSKSKYNLLLDKPSKILILKYQI